VNGSSRRTVDEIAGPYANFLYLPPPALPGVCSVCHIAVDERYPRCHPCNQARRVLGERQVADVVVPMSFAPAGLQFARELYTYKRSTVPPEIRASRTVGLAAVLWKWLTVHESCIARHVGIDGFDRITVVPSTSGRPGPHPLREIVAELVEITRSRYEDLLSIDNPSAGQREQSAERFKATRSVVAEDVLVIDDTWTTGAHAQSAAAALNSAGARTVAIVAIGRWLVREWGDNEAFYQEVRRRGWAWDRCCLDP